MYIARAARRASFRYSDMSSLLFYDRKVCGSEARSDQRALASEDRENVFFSKSMEKNRSKKNTQRSGAQKRKTKKEKEAAVMEAVKEAVAEMERIKLGPTKIWTGLVLHQKDIVCLACLVEIERYRSVFLFTGEYRESGCACVRRGKCIGITLGSLRMYIHFDAGIRVESRGPGET